MLDTGSGSIRLSSIGSLDHALFERLLELLGRALASDADRRGARWSTTSDGRIEIVLRPAARAAVAELRTPLGVFRGPDYDVEIRACDTRSAGQASGSGA